MSLKNIIYDDDEDIELDLDNAENVIYKGQQLKLHKKNIRPTYKYGTHKPCIGCYFYKIPMTKTPGSWCNFEGSCNLPIDYTIKNRILDVLTNL